MTAHSARPSCLTCPSILKPNEQNAVLGTNVGGPICGRRLIAIGRPGQETARPIEQLTAEKCNEYGSPRPDYSAEARSSPIRLDVAMPSINDRTASHPEMVTSCHNCTNFVPATSLARVGGWNSAFCRADGQLILDDRLQEYPKTCPSKSFGSRPHLMSTELILLPEFANGFGRRSLASLLKNRSSDPQLFETEHPVTAAHAKHGIRAWRTISDPEGVGPDIKMPIFARDHFDSTTQSKIPVIGDQERPEDYYDHGGFVYKVGVLWMELDETPALWGPAGVGKTELFRHLAFLMGLPFERISISRSSEIDDLAGKPGYSPERGTYYTYGRIPRAWTQACVVGLDEPNAGPPDVWQFIRPMTDNSKQLVLDQNNGERLERHPCCYLGMAMNPSWDPRNTGIESLADADGSRLMHIYMDLPPADVERSILRKALERDGWESSSIDPTLKVVMECAQDLRALSQDGVIPVSWGLRSQIQVARALRFFHPITAYRIGVADSLAPEAQQAILDIVRSKFEG